MIPRHGILTLPGRVPLGSFVAGFLAFFIAGCGATEGESGVGTEAAAQEAEVITLGPRDGHDLPATDLERVAVGTPAPDFSLETITGDTLTLSEFRGEKDVVLVFYRGHW